MPKVIHDIEVYKNTLKIILMHFSNVPEIQINEFVGLFSMETFKKKSVIISPNNIVNNKFYFIAKGLVRIYYTNDNKEIISDFKEDNSFFMNGYTLFTGLPNIDYHEAMEDTVCLTAAYNDIEKLAKEYHALEHLGRKMVENYYAAYLKENYNKLFLSAEERYAVFVKERASIMNKVSLRYVASHLGIAPETLSRLRARYQSIKS